MTRTGQSTPRFVLMVVVAGFMPAAGAVIIAHCCILIIKSQFGITDMLLRDEESWEKDCEPGFSAPVFVATPQSP